MAAFVFVLGKYMEYILVITCFVLVVLGATGAIAYSLRKQREAAMREVAMISQRLTDIEKILEESRNLETSESRNPETSKSCDTETSNSRDTETSNSQDAEIPKDLSAMTDEELFQYITKFIKEQKLYRWPDFNRAAVMQHFSLSAARVGAAFAQGGGQSLPEFVRNCRLDHACRLMVEHPTMSFVEVGEASGYQRTTTFYHDFKARFGMAPAEYRKMKSEKLATATFVTKR